MNYIFFEIKSKKIRIFLDNLHTKLELWNIFVENVTFYKVEEE